MPLFPLTTLVSKLKPIREICSAGQSREVFGLLAAAKPTVLAAVALNSKPLVIVTSHAQAANLLVEDLHAWFPGEIGLFPAIESLPYERVRLDRRVAVEREAVAHALGEGVVDIVVAPVRALLQPIELMTSLTASRTVRVGNPIHLDELVKTCAAGGYAETALVEDPATFARRGGVLDVFPAGAPHPVRVELFGNAVESLREFDPATQRSIAPVRELTIMAISASGEDGRLNALLQLSDLDTSQMNAEAKTRWFEDIQRLEDGFSPEELTIFSPYMFKNSGSLLQRLPAGATVVVDTASETIQLAGELYHQAQTLKQELERSGDIPRGLMEVLLKPEDLLNLASSVPSILLRAGTATVDTALDLSGLFIPPTSYGGRLRTFVQDVARKSWDLTVVASHQPDRVTELLREADIPVTEGALEENQTPSGTRVVPAAISAGWTLPEQRITVLSDHELFGQSRPRAVGRRSRTAARDTFFAGFTSGDYVVHIEHGIGRYEGMTRMTLDGVEREYGLIQYAGADRVYVPTDQLERLTRYVGVGDSPPPLNKLGGGDWQRTRSRAKQAAADVARELIDLYAKRMARPGHQFEPDSPWQQELEASFPYPETPDQLQAVFDVKGDMEKPHPMDRLVCADVGYGKTEVAIRAAFKAVMDGKQAAVLAPTTILAQQHGETFIDRYAAFPVKVEVISRFRSPAQQRDILRRLAAGEVDVIIGTHRLLQKDVQFKQLGLLVVDEEQRFGVKHKEQLKKFRESVDVLTLTATPIPRTLHMGLVGIREISVIDTAPEGRMPIKTFLQPFDESLIRQAVLRELDRDGQVYIVHNKVATIEALAERIRRLVPEARVVVGHGQMDETQLEKVMLDFAHHETDVLICSTIIENGLDIPNVNTIVVNHAHRLGLTQLYQLRGRVGRSPNQAYAYLLYPRDVRLSHDASRRMEAVFEAQNLGAGFTIAMKDLEIRGAGNLLGAEQSGNATAIGFDLYTRMIADAVEQLRGTPVEEERLVTVDLPLTMLLPRDYVVNEEERLTLYRRIALVADENEVQHLADELRDRFGPVPDPVVNLLTSVRIKLLAQRADIESVSLGPDVLIVRAKPPGLFDRVSLYKRYGTDAKISTNVLRVPRRLMTNNWIAEITQILDDVVQLRESVRYRETVGA